MAESGGIRFLGGRQLVVQNFPSILVDIVRLGIWLVLLMLIFAPMERLFPVHRQPIFRRDFAADLGYYFINGLLPKLSLAPLLAAVGWLLHFITPSALQAWSADLPLAARIAAMLVVGEFGVYWGHRWMHEVPVLWRFHAIHHSAEQMDWLVNTRAHPVDMIIPRVLGFVPLYALGLAQPSISTTDWAVLAFVFISVLWGFFVHANLSWRFGWLERLIATPAFHHWHHTNDGPAYVNKNYAAMVPGVDWLFGTLYLPGRRPLRYGSDTAVATGLARQMIQPLTPDRRG
jgi:sterol desaturase/sphingolipid hydroxylase (fatty acid hydroxylase superfamily)